MTEETLKNLVINKVPSQEVYDAMLAAGLIESNELYLVTDGSGGGALIVETTKFDNGTYDKGWKTVMDADDIVAAYLSGRTVIIHFIEYTGYIGGEEKYANIIGYQPEYYRTYGNTEILLPAQYMDGGITSIDRSQDGKFVFGLYVD